MKESCEVIKDLLPLHVEGLCRPETTEYIDKHLSECTGCLDTLNRMKKEIEINEQSIERRELEDFDNLSSIWNKEMLLSMVKGGVLTGIMMVVVLLIFIFICWH